MRRVGDDGLPRPGRCAGPCPRQRDGEPGGRLRRARLQRLPGGQPHRLAPSCRLRRAADHRLPALGRRGGGDAEGAAAGAAGALLRHGAGRRVPQGRHAGGRLRREAGRHGVAGRERAGHGRLRVAGRDPRRQRVVRPARVHRARSLLQESRQQLDVRQHGRAPRTQQLLPDELRRDELPPHATDRQRHALRQPADADELPRRHPGRVCRRRRVDSHRELDVREPDAPDAHAGRHQPVRSGRLAEGGARQWLQLHLTDGRGCHRLQLRQQRAGHHTHRALPAAGRRTQRLPRQHGDARRRRHSRVGREGDDAERGELHVHRQPRRPLPGALPGAGAGRRLQGGRQRGAPTRQLLQGRHPDGGQRRRDPCAARGRQPHQQPLPQQLGPPARRVSVRRHRREPDRAQHALRQHGQPPARAAGRHPLLRRTHDHQRGELPGAHRHQRAVRAATQRRPLVAEHHQRVGRVPGRVQPARHQLVGVRRDCVRPAPLVQARPADLLLRVVPAQQVQPRPRLPQLHYGVPQLRLLHTAHQRVGAEAGEHRPVHPPRDPVRQLSVRRPLRAGHHGRQQLLGVHRRRRHQVPALSEGLLPVRRAVIRVVDVSERLREEQTRSSVRRLQARTLGGVVLLHLCVGRELRPRVAVDFLPRDRLPLRHVPSVSDGS